MKKTLVLGASLNPVRYSNMAINRLVNNKFDVVAIGLREGHVAGVEISKEQQLFDDIDSVRSILIRNAKRNIIPI